MKFNRPYALKEICDLINAAAIGNEAVEILGINEIHRVEEGDIVFVDHPKYYEKALQSAASVVLINQEVEVPVGKAIVICKDPFESFNTILNHFNPFQFFSNENPTDTKIGKGTQIHSSVVIGNNVSIGKNCWIMPQVCIHDNVEIGDNAIIQAGTVLGSFGFYYKNRPNHFDRLLSAGKVVIEDNVEIGANCTIDKGVTAETRIGAGTKIDNMVQIGHDTIIGKKCLIAANCGIAGCVTIGDEVVLWGQAGITSGVTIGNKAVISAKSGVSKSLEGGRTYAGTPADDLRSKYKEMAMLRRLPELFNKLKPDEK